MIVLNLLLIIYYTSSLGKSDKPKMEPFIVNGVQMKIEDVPYIALVDVECKDEFTGAKSTWICGSSIINQFSILTAAHCLYSCSAKSRISAALGNAHIMSGAVAHAAGFVMHDDYNDASLDCDIGMIKLKMGALKFGKKIKRVAVMPNPPYNKKALVAGWGLTDEINEISPDYLQGAEQKILSKSECINILDNLPDGTICATHVDHGAGYASRGDSGGPLVVDGYIQVGLVSYKIMDKNEAVIVFTDVGYYYDWIRAVVKKFCKC